MNYFHPCPWHPEITVIALVAPCIECSKEYLEKNPDAFKNLVAELDQNGRLPFLGGDLKLEKLIKSGWRPKE